MYSLRVSLLLPTVRRCGCLRQVTVHRLSSFSSGKTFQSKRILLEPLTSLWTKTPPSRSKLVLTTKPRKWRPRFKEDGVDPSMQLIYENNMNRYYFWGQLIINVMGVPSLGWSAYILATQWHTQDFTITGGILTPMVYILFYGFLMTTVNGLCRRSVTRIYCDKALSNFTLVTRDWKLMRTKIMFDLSQVARKPPGQFFGHFYGNLMIKNQSFMVSPTDFVQPVFYNKFMGYELGRSTEHEGIKDIDLKDYMVSLRPEMQEKMKKEKMERKQ